MPALSVRSKMRDARFFLSLQGTKSVREACLDAGYSRQSVYRWRKCDQAFEERWQDALLKAADQLEDDADSRAVHGTDVPVRGGGIKRKYSDTLLLARLKAIKPDQYREPVVRRAAEPELERYVAREQATSMLMLRWVQEGRITIADLPPYLRHMMKNGGD